MQMYESCSLALKTEFYPTFYPSCLEVEPNVPFSIVSWGLIYVLHHSETNHLSSSVFSPTAATKRAEHDTLLMNIPPLPLMHTQTHFHRLQCIKNCSSDFSKSHKEALNLQLNAFGTREDTWQNRMW